MTMRHIGLFGALVFSGVAHAELQTSPPAREQAPLQVPNPHYATVTESVVVDAPVDQVWARVGGYCKITEWMNSPEWEDCRYLQGDGGPGSVRTIVNEVMVGQTLHSYTYAQAPRKNTLYNLAHGTLSAEALTPTTTRLTYTMLRDDSVLPDEAARQRDADGRHARISEWLKNMKVLAEGGKLPPKRQGAFAHRSRHRSSIPILTTPVCRCRSSSTRLSRGFGPVSARRATSGSGAFRVAN